MHIILKDANYAERFVVLNAYTVHAKSPQIANTVLNVVSNCLFLLHPRTRNYVISVNKEAYLWGRFITANYPRNHPVYPKSGPSSISS